MDNRRELVTVKDVRQAIKEARAIYVEVRMGCFEAGVKTSKAEALRLFSGYEGSVKAEEIESSTGIFGHLTGDGLLFLGC